MQAKWLKMLLGIAFSILLMSGCGAGTDQEGVQDEEQAPADGAQGAYDQAAAEEAYNTGTCISCHGGNLEGSAGPSLENVGAKYNKDEIVDIINNGIGQMPPLGDNLDEEAKQNLAAWLADQK